MTVFQPRRLSQFCPLLIFRGGQAGPLWIAVVCSVVLTLLLMPLPKTGRAVNILFDCAHAPVFALLSYSLHRQFSARAPYRSSIRFLLVPGTAVFLGITSELIQEWTGRTASLQDIVANVLGVAAGSIWFRHESVRSKRPDRLVAAILVTASWILPASAIFDVYRQRQEMPLIASFEDELEMSRWSQQDCKWERVPSRATHGHFALSVQLKPSNYPGIALNTPVADWSGYETLAFDAFVEDFVTVELGLKVHDAPHNGDVRDRYNGWIVLERGATTVRVSLDEVLEAPQGRPMDLTRIKRLQLYAVQPTQPQSFFVDNFRLE